MPPKLAELFQIDRDISVMRMKLHEAEIIRRAFSISGLYSPEEMPEEQGGK